MPLETFPFDAAEYLDDAEAQIALIADALATGNGASVAAALGIVARARGMTKVARESGLTREALYKSLSGTGDPRLSTMLGVMKSLRLSLAVTRAAGPGKTRKVAKVKPATGTRIKRTLKARSHKPIAKRAR